MAAVIDHPEQAERKVILHNVSWQTYERLLAECQESGSTRFAYDRGVLEIMVLSLKHERLKHIIATLVELLAEGLGIDIEGAGSTTFRREDLARGFEPDACFYIRHAEWIRTQERIDPAVDPAPDLVIEIDIASPSLDKFPLFASFGVPEVWRFDGKELTLFKLEGKNYARQPQSTVLSGVTGAQLTALIQESSRLKRAEWLHRVRAEARKL